MEAILIPIDRVIFDRIYKAKYILPTEANDFGAFAKYYNKEIAVYKKLNTEFNKRRNRKQIESHKKLKKTLDKAASQRNIEKILARTQWESLRVRTHTKRSLEKIISENPEYLKSNQRGKANNYLQKAALQHVFNLDIWDLVEEDLATSELGNIPQMILDKAKAKAGKRDDFSNISIQKSTVTLLKMVKDYKLLSWDEVIYYLLEIDISTGDTYKSAIDLVKDRNANIENQKTPGWDEEVANMIDDMYIDSVNFSDISSFIRAYLYLNDKRNPPSKP